MGSRSPGNAICACIDRGTSARAALPRAARSALVKCGAAFAAGAGFPAVFSVPSSGCDVITCPPRFVSELRELEAQVCEGERPSRPVEIHQAGAASSSTSRGMPASWANTAPANA